MAARYAVPPHLAERCSESSMLDVGSDSSESPPTATTTSHPQSSRPKLVLTALDWPSLGEEDKDVDDDYVKSKLESLMCVNTLILEDIGRLFHQVNKLTEMVSNMIVDMGYEIKPSAIRTPRGFSGGVIEKRIQMYKTLDAKLDKGEAGDSLSKTISPQTAKVDNAEAEDSPRKTMSPRTAEVARFDIQFASPDQVPKLRDSESSGLPSGQIGLTSPEDASAKPIIEPSDTTSSFTTSPEESEERDFASPDENSSPSLQDHKAEERAPGLSGQSSSPSLSSEESELGGPAEGNKVSQQAQRLADHDALFAYFKRYLTNPNHTRQITTQHDDATRPMARSFKSAVCSPSRKAAISRSEFDDMRATIRKMSDSDLVDLYIALSQRYREDYKYDN